MAAHRAGQVKGGIDRQSTGQQGSRGVSLFEVLITLLVVTIIVAGLLQFTGHILVCYDRNQVESREALKRWNTTRALRISHPDSAETFRPVPGARPLYRFILQNGGKRWEVLCAEK